MNWNSATEFLAMGGYGLYVWSAWGVAVLCGAVEPALAWRRHRAALSAVAGGADRLRMDRP